MVQQNECSPEGSDLNQVIKRYECIFISCINSGNVILRDNLVLGILKECHSYRGREQRLYGTLYHKSRK